MRGHQEAAIPADRDDAATGIQQLRRDSTGDGDAHGGEAVRDEDRVGLRGAEEPAHEDLVGSDVGDEQVFRP